MKFFLDTADLAEIEEAASWGVLAGVTTNPTLYARVGGRLADFPDHIKRICETGRRAGLGRKRGHDPRRDRPRRPRRWHPSPPTSW